MGVEGGLPLFGLFGHLVGLDPLNNLDKMGSNRIVERIVVRWNLDIDVPAFKGDGLVVVGEVELLEGLWKAIGVALAVVFVDLAEKNLDRARGAVLWGLGLH